MKNYERYMDKVLEAVVKPNGGFGLVKKMVYHKNDCAGRNCIECKEKFDQWLHEEYIPVIDWSKVPRDTPILVTRYYSTDREQEVTEREVKEHFASLNGDYVTFYANGRTSWTGSHDLYSVHRTLVKLVREEDIEKYSI